MYLQSCALWSDEYLPQFHEVFIQAAFCDAQEVVDVCSNELKGYHQLRHLSLEDVWRTNNAHW